MPEQGGGLLPSAARWGGPHLADDGAQSEATGTQTTFFMISFNHKCDLSALSAYFGLILLYVRNWGTKRRDAIEAHSP